mgnify:CR=1 FL=1
MLYRRIVVLLPQLSQKRRVESAKALPDGSQDDAISLRRTTFVQARFSRFSRRVLHNTTVSHRRTPVWSCLMLSSAVRLRARDVVCHACRKRDVV